jgi:hypothetical protein
VFCVDEIFGNVALVATPEGITGTSLKLIFSFWLLLFIFVDGPELSILFIEVLL